MKSNTLANKTTSTLSLRSFKTTAFELAFLSRCTLLLFQQCSVGLLSNTTSPTSRTSLFLKTYTQVLNHTSKATNTNAISCQNGMQLHLNKLLLKEDLTLAKHFRN